MHSLTGRDSVADYSKDLSLISWGAAPTHEQLAQMVATLEETVRELEEQNVTLRKSALAFGALAERLNARLAAERRVSSRVLSRTRVWVVLGRVWYGRRNFVIP